MERSLSAPGGGFTWRDRKTNSLESTQSTHGSSTSYPYKYASLRIYPLVWPIIGPGQGSGVAPLHSKASPNPDSRSVHHVMLHKACIRVTINCTR